jgi:F-type H+-transporting ATPase subunit b
MNEQRIQEILEIETQAQEMLAQAKREAEGLPVKAESEAHEMVEKARAAANEEARRILEQAQAANEADKIMAAAEDRMAQTGKLAEKNLEKAVTLVLDRVLGKA